MQKLFAVPSATQGEPAAADYAIANADGYAHVIGFDSYNSIELSFSLNAEKTEFTAKLTAGDWLVRAMDAAGNILKSFVIVVEGADWSRGWAKYVRDLEGALLENPHGHYKIDTPDGRSFFSATKTDLTNELNRARRILARRKARALGITPRAVQSIDIRMTDY